MPTHTTEIHLRKYRFFYRNAWSSTEISATSTEIPPTSTEIPTPSTEMPVASFRNTDNFYRNTGDSEIFAIFTNVPKCFVRSYIEKLISRVN